MAFEGEDKPTLYHEIAKALLPEDCDRAVESAAVNLLDCESHVRLLVDDYVMERIASIPLEAKKAFSGTRDRRK